VLCGIAANADEQGRRPHRAVFRVLLHGQIVPVLEFAGEFPGADVFRHADDGEQRIVVCTAETELLAEGVLVGPDGVGHGAADDDHRPAAGDILRRETATAHDARADSVEVAQRYDLLRVTPDQLRRIAAWHPRHAAGLVAALGKSQVAEALLRLRGTLDRSDRSHANGEWCQMMNRAVVRTPYQ
jgi:hypothetical protein